MTRVKNQHVVSDRQGGWNVKRADSYGNDPFPPRDKK